MQPDFKAREQGFKNVSERGRNLRIYFVDTEFILCIVGIGGGL